jgi:glycosyltransferase involved in cell wall biosynthesis
MRRLVFVTQQVDPAHPALAAVVPMIRALAARVDRLVVLADRAVPAALPANCTALSFAASTQAGRGVRFAYALGRELAQRPRPIAVVAHMCPIYAVLAAPLARPLGVPVVLWFTHWRRSTKLRLAERLSTAVVTVDRRSFPLDSPKVRPIGHGIDVAAFACSEPPLPPPLRLVALGRYSESKGLATVLRAVALTPAVRLEVHGPTLTPAEVRHRAELERLVAELELADRVTLGEPVPGEDVPRLLAGADALVNNMRTGAPDKVVYEAAAACRPVLASNAVFDELLDGLGAQLRFGRDDAPGLAARLAELAALPDGERRRIGRELRGRVDERHSVERWADRLLEVVAA